MILEYQKWPKHLMGIKLISQGRISQSLSKTIVEYMSDIQSVLNLFLIGAITKGAQKSPT